MQEQLIQPKEYRRRDFPAKLSKDYREGGREGERIDDAVGQLGLFGCKPFFGLSGKWSVERD